MVRAFGWPEAWFIVAAAQWTILLSLTAFVGGFPGGLLIALARTSGTRWLRNAAASFILFFQGTPLLMQLFLTFFGGAVLGVNMTPWTAAAIALTLNSSAFLGEIWRGCIEAVPHGQTEAARALNLPRYHLLRRIIFPQARKIALAPTVGFLVQVVKGTALASILGFTELTRAGQIINNATFQPFLVFGLVAALYFIICWPLSITSAWLERRTNSGIPKSSVAK